MQICSDDQFQQLTMPEDLSQQCQSKNTNSNQKYKEIHINEINPTLSTIKIVNQLKKIYRVEIQLSDNKVDMNFLQNQYYSIKVMKQGKTIKDNIQRRYSDFDLLFEVLYRNYPGFIFPAFPQKGLVSYVKTKVSVTKDESFTKNRIKMIQRFLTTILNEEKFNIDKCPQIKKFFSNPEFEIFKKTQKQRANTNIIDSTWSMVKNYFKLNNNNKYAPLIEQIKNDKRPFQMLHSKVKDIYQLLKSQIEQNQKLTLKDWKDNQLPNFSAFKELIKGFNTNLHKVQQQIEELDFNLFCENQDFMMMLKKIQQFQELKSSQSNYKNLPQIEREFNQRKLCIKRGKLVKENKLKSQYQEILRQICHSERQK